MSSQQLIKESDSKKLIFARNFGDTLAKHPYLELRCVPLTIFR